MKEAKATHLKAYRLNKNRFLLVSHPHYPSRFPYFNRLYALICFHIGTINLAFRRGGARVKSNMVYILCKHMVYMLSITNEHKK